MSSLVVLYLSSHYRIVLLPHYELVPPPASVGYVQTVDVVSSDILSRNGKSATMQDQSQERTRRVFRLVQSLWIVKTLHPVLLYYEM
jgi:hypothetical protein